MDNGNSLIEKQRQDEQEDNQICKHNSFGTRHSVLGACNLCGFFATNGRISMRSWARRMECNNLCAYDRCFTNYLLFRVA